MRPMAIVTPIWREELTPQEYPFVRITERSNADVDRWFCAPEDLDLAYYRDRFPTWRVRTFPTHVFGSVRSYSLWLTGPEFYQTFSDYEFITICQTDAVLVKDLRHLDMTELDYVGAPWDPPIRALTVGRRVYVASDFDGPEGLWLTRRFGRRIAVGNGGLSTRRTSALLTLTERLVDQYPPAIREHTLEDALICAVGARHGLRIADAVRAGSTYQETQAIGLAARPDVFGFHGLWRWNEPLAQSLVRELLG